MVANGGTQKLHPDFHEVWFPRLEKHKVVLSDHFMRENIYKETMKKIKESDTRNVVIIGGSASSFSCAWLLLNGPATWGKNDYKDPWASH